MLVCGVCWRGGGRSRLCLDVLPADRRESLRDDSISRRPAVVGGVRKGAFAKVRLGFRFSIKLALFAGSCPCAVWNRLVVASPSWDRNNANNGSAFFGEFALYQARCLGRRVGCLAKSAFIERRVHWHWIITGWRIAFGTNRANQQTKLPLVAQRRLRFLLWNFLRQCRRR